MVKTCALAWREFQSFLYSPIAYAALAIFFGVASLFFFGGDFRPGQPAQMRSFFELTIFILAAVVPILTMRLVSEEFSRGTIETLMTAPVTDAQVILGKFFGAVLFYLLLLAPTLLYVLLLVIYGSPEPGPIFTSYVGLILVGVTFISIGLLASTCTRFQLVSAIASLVFLLIMTILAFYLLMEATGWLRKVIMYGGFTWRYQNFTRGTIQLEDVIFFLRITVLSLFLSVKILESRKWRA